MARIELPESKLKIRRRRMRRRLALVGLLLLLLLCATFAGLSRLSALQIGSIALSGNRTLASTTLTAFVEERLEGYYFYVLPKRNILLYPKREIADALMREFPLLSAAEVHAADFQTLAVQLAEREPRALWCGGAGPCYFMDAEGAVYAPAPQFSTPVYYSYSGSLRGSALPKQYLSPEQFSALAALVEAVAREVEDDTLEGVSVDAEEDVRMRFGSGFVLLFALGTGEGDTFERFMLARTAEPFSGRKLSEFEYLDLRFGDKLYYKVRQ